MLDCFSKSTAIMRTKVTMPITWYFQYLQQKINVLEMRKLEKRKYGLAGENLR